MQIESERLLSLQRALAATTSTLRQRRNNDDQKVSTTRADTVSTNQTKSLTNYYLIREPEVLNATKRERIAQLSFFDKLRYTFSETHHLERGKYENAPAKLIEQSLGPEVYRASVSHRFDALPWNSDIILRQMGTPFEYAPEKVNNQYASGKYDGGGNLAFIRMWCDADQNRLEIRLHDAARKKNPPLGKRPLTREDLTAFEINLSIISKFLYHCSVDSEKDADKHLRLANIVTKERLI